jgi:hypothetical protein
VAMAFELCSEMVEHGSAVRSMRCNTSRGSRRDKNVLVIELESEEVGTDVQRSGRYVWV